MYVVKRKFVVIVNSKILIGDNLDIEFIFIWLFVVIYSLLEWLFGI